MTLKQPKESARWWASPIVWVLGCWIVGSALARAGAIDNALAIGFACIGCAAVAVGWRWNPRIVAIGGATALVGAASLWWTVRVGAVDAEATAVRVDEESRLVRIEGVIEGDVYIQQKPSGAMGRFDYRPPKTLFLVRIEREFGDDGVRDVVAGRRTVVVDSPSYDGRLRAGDRVEVTGWLSGPRRPTNIGERDHAVWMHDRGMVGRLTLKTRGNCRLIDLGNGAPGTPDDGGWHDELVRGASWALWYGSDASSEVDDANADEAESRALLASILLGEGRGSMGDLDASFRDTGLGHLLAISGLHLGILAAGVWLIVALLTGRPSWAAAATIGVIVLYLLVVPPRVPILRAGLMTAVACAALTWGRRSGAVTALAAAAWLLMLWRPGDVFTAGFQLSFVVVGALILYADRAGRWIYDPLDEHLTSRQRAVRWGADYLGVTLVAWCFATPLAAYHFGRVTPIALPMSAAMLPLVAALLWSGYAKIVLTALWPALGAAVMPIVQTLADATATIVHAAAQLPGGGWTVPEPSAWWVVATLALMAAIFSGTFKQRRAVAGALLVGCAAWLYAPTIRAAVSPDGDAMRITMFAVGDGSAYLIESQGERMMFDCGSSQHLDITTAAVGPALRSMGITRVPTLVLSHPDLDHFSGAIELMDDFGVERLVLTEAFIAEATDAPTHWREGAPAWSAAAAILQHAEARGVAVITIARGWTESLGTVRIETLWPPPGDDDESNNGSIVLRLSAADRRVLLTGDVQERPMATMLADPSIDLRADVLELPHHGSMVDSAPVWVDRVDPSIVLQSSGRARLRKDKWDGLLEGRSRNVTAWHGMTRVTIGANGGLKTRRFLDSGPE